MYRDPRCSRRPLVDSCPQEMPPKKGTGAPKGNQNAKKRKEPPDLTPLEVLACSPGPHDIIATRCRARPAPRSRISALCDTSPAPQPPDQARVLAGARDLDRSDVVTTAAAATAATAATAAHVRIVVALAGARDRSSASPTAVAATATTTIDDTAADFAAAAAATAGYDIHL